jgi:23S rRNA pseudouridine1911/1915/1917 synthase
MTGSFARQILFEDRYILVVNKLAGQLSQGGAFAGKTETCTSNLVALGAQYLGKDPYLIHRLDRPSSGVLILGKTKAAAAALSEDLQQRKLNKHYLAVVNGHMPCYDHDQPIHVKSLITSSGGKKNKTEVIVNRPTPEEERSLLTRKSVQVAELSYRVLHNLSIPLHDGSLKQQSLLKIQLHTGRKHQIRAQLSSLGHPIVGDGKYGCTSTFRDRDIALHAARVEFSHPINRSQLVSVVAPVPAIWVRRFGDDILPF